MVSKSFEDAVLFPSVAMSAWREAVERDLNGSAFERKLVTRTYEGVAVQPLYAPSAGGAARTAFTGVGTMARGAEVLGSSQHGWEICQEHTDPEIARANAAILEDLLGGVGGVVLRLDLAGRAGLDPDDPSAGALCGRDGVMAASLADLRDVFRGVHLNMIGVGLEAGSAFVPAAALLAALWREQGVAESAATGAFNADPIAVLARDGALAYPIEEGLLRLSMLARWTSQRYPRVTAVRVGTAAYHHAGATATQDIALAMATGIEYLRAMTRAGMSVDAAAKQIRFSFAVGTAFFLAASKLRAARRMWARVVEAAGGGVDARRMRMHVRPSKRVMTTRDPWVNILRNTACLFGAAIGGADAIGSMAFDASLGTASALGRRLARNTHHVLMEECHLHRVADPAGGSWYIEQLTDDLAQRGWEILQQIERRGGMVAALRDGWVHDQIDAAREPRERNIATRRDTLVGVSDFPNLDEKWSRASAPDFGALRAAAIERVRGQRKAAAWSASTALPAGMDDLVDAARAGASLGQIAAWVGKPETGETLPVPVALHPYAGAFERLRDASDRYAEITGARPSLFLATLGPAHEHLARTNFVSNVVEAGGIRVVTGPASEDVDAIVEAFRASGCRLAAVSAADKRLPDIVPRLVPRLHSAGASTVVLAGNPGDREAEYAAHGVDRFVFVKCDVVALLEDLLRREGVLS